MFGTLPLHLKGFQKAFILSPMGRPNFWKTFVGDTIPMDSLRYLYVGLTDLPPAQQLTNPSAGVPLFEMSAQDRNVLTNFYALGVQLNVQQMATDQSGLLNKTKNQLNYSRYLAQEISAAAILNNGTTSTYTGGIDNLSLVNTAHLYNGGTWSNQSTAATLSNYSLEAMIQDVAQNHRTQAGNFWLGSMGWDLIIPTALDFRAQRILGATKVAGSNDNDPNQIGNIGYTKGNPFLTNTTAYWLIPKGEDNPIIFAHGPTPAVEEQAVQGSFNKLILVGDQWVFTWKMAMGIQQNPGA